MENNKQLAAKTFLEEHGIVIPEKVLAKLFNLLDVKPGQPIIEYQVGDFVCYYEGMGEQWYGTIRRRIKGAYEVSAYNQAYIQTVTDGDMRGHSTPEDADNYLNIRRA